MNITDILKTLAPIQLKSVRNTIDTFLETIENDTNIDDNELHTTENWFIAIDKEDIDAIKIFIERKFDINSKSNDKYGRTALMRISMTGNIYIAKLLINAGADINIKDNDMGNTSLKLAIFKSQYYIVNLLIYIGADINIRSDCGNTALITASQKNLYEGVKLLCDAGADINIKNKNGDTALTLCSSNTIGDNILKLLEDTQIKVKDLSDMNMLKRIKIKYN